MDFRMHGAKIKIIFFMLKEEEEIFNRRVMSL
jgi:hypothetical protein